MLRTYQEGFNQDFLRAQKAKSIEKLRSDMVSRNKLRNSSDTNLIGHLIVARCIRLTDIKKDMMGRHT